VLGPEKELETTYIANGQLQLIFWPALDGVPAATNLHVLAHCAGQQDPVLFWQLHDHIFENQSQYGRIDEAAAVELGVSLGAVKEPLEQCITSGEGLEMVQILDDIRRERGISGRPVFQIGDQRIFGFQSFEVFSNAIDQELE
jgi:protein-disulfide isomerase